MPFSRAFFLNLLRFGFWSVLKILARINSYKTFPIGWMSSHRQIYWFEIHHHIQHHILGPQGLELWHKSTRESQSTVPSNVLREFCGNSGVWASIEKSIFGTNIYGKKNSTVQGLVMYSQPQNPSSPEGTGCSHPQMHNTAVNSSYDSAFSALGLIIKSKAE